MLAIIQIQSKQIIHYMEEFKVTNSANNYAASTLK